MAFVNGVKSITPGFGHGAQFRSEGVSLTGTATKTLTLTGGLKRGYARVKTSSVNAATTTAVELLMDDGSTTVAIASSPATPAGRAIDIVVPFCLDIAATTFSVVFTLGGATTTETADLEVVGTV